MLKYTDKTYKEITDKVLSNTSLMNLFNILEDEDNNYLLNIFKTYEVDDEVKNDPQYFEYRDLEISDFWENLSYEVYNNEKIWWMLPLGNDVSNPFEYIDNDKTIKVLDSSLKFDIIKDIKKVAEI